MPISDEKIIASKHPLGRSQGKFPNNKKGEVKFEIYCGPNDRGGLTFAMRGGIRRHCTSQIVNI